MTWLNNTENNSFQIRSKLDIDITKLYWDNPAYGIDQGFTNTQSNITSYLIPLKIVSKKVICGTDFLALPSSGFMLDVSTFDLSTHIYYIRVSANIKGFNSNNSDTDILVNNFKSGKDQNIASGIRLVFLNDTNILQNTLNIVRNNSVSDLLSPYNGKIQCLSNFPFYRNTTGYFDSTEFNFSSLQTINSLYSLHSLNKNIEPWSAQTPSTIFSNPYSVNNKINPVDHFSFDFFLIREYSQYRAPGTNIGSSTLSKSIITKDSTRSILDYNYLSFFICSSKNTSTTTSPKAPFMYYSSPDDLNKNDIISNVEIEIIRYPR